MFETMQCMDMLTKFLQKLFSHLAVKQNKYVVIADLIKKFPLSVNKTNEEDNWHRQKKFLKNVVCHKCHSVYENISQCMEK